ncbi:hypothetical protein LUZ60_014187 [Juncus effusus]|nr:hypothetical protein LUZ60_014187 [Juncus effusus]
MAAASLSISISSSTINPSFLHLPSLKPHHISLKPSSCRARSSLSSSSSPFLTALETPPHPETGGGSDAMSILLGHRMVFLGGEITDLMADCVLSQLLLLDAQDETKEIRIYINSAGGSLSATMAIFDVIKLIKSPVQTIAVGQASSTAALILGAGSPGRRFAMPNARIMLRQPSGSASGEVRQIEFHAVELLSTKMNVVRIVAGLTGQPIGKVKKDLDRDFYMGPAEAVKYGLIDGILDEDKMIPIPDISTRVRKPKTGFSDLGKHLRPEIPDDEIY